MKAKRTAVIALLLLGLVAGLPSCDQDTSTSQPVQSSRQPAPSPPTPPAQPQGPPPFDAPWPPPAKGGGEVALSDNLLARNYYVIMDSSGSMNEVRCSGNRTKSEAAKTALAQFARITPKDANMGLAVFDAYGIAERVPLGLENRDKFIAAVNATAPGNGTPLHDALLLGYRRLEETARRQAGYGEYHLVVITDGQAYPQNQDPTPVVAYILRQSPVVIHTIGFCIGTDHSLNQPGRTVYRAADNPRELQQGLEEVLAESPDFDLAAFK
ncbi:vWA domain-containing protein [Syntrophobacter fumaroxidans]|uniref:von Willebrand factor, type A n=1 Tax=Syntrophobacter fumaroxidans (strain DSM 10017 / MPOB) TaxID=335543 RepID=A0LP07_SYNFM|nr:vWA domain-containing protein [Syntrophobacter fumaroxidans]ABK19159.1 von Willebrand factor, type A [Syntrophobacter fumaroxidans MPOB]